MVCLGEELLVIKIISSCWPLFLGMALIMLGNGLQNSLLGLHASHQGFSISVTGLVMSGYYVGMIIGAKAVPKIVQRVGHIRSFGALASLASTSILVHYLFIEPWVWWALRFITGFAYAGLYVVAESWLNDTAENETRGQLLGFYMLIAFSGLAGGQFMLNIASPEGFQLFILISIFVSIAVIPILISVSRAPAFETNESVSILQLIKVSPLGVFGTFASGTAAGAIFGMGAVYASTIGLNTKEISFFMGSLIIGGGLMQYPIGRVSDVIGRRKIIILTCFIGAVASLGAIMFNASGLLIYLQIAIVGGLTLPLYPLCTTHTNDYLTPGQRVAASGTLVMAYGSGAAIGAPFVAIYMELMGPQGFFHAIGISFALISILAFVRSTQREATAIEGQGDFMPLTPTPTSLSINPSLELEEIEAASGVSKVEVQTSFEELVDELNSESASEKN
jgi:MFS family permease